MFTRSLAFYIYPSSVFKNATLLNMVNLFCQEKATMLSLSRLGIRVKE